MLSCSSRALQRAVGALLILTASVEASAMEDESIFSYTRLEASGGKVRGQSTSEQSLVVDGWVGSDFHRLWYLLEAEGRAGRTQANEMQFLYGRYVVQFWDAQIGLRRDQQPNRHDYLTLGVRGLAPYVFDVDLKAFVRDDGKLSARTRVENAFLMTNRFIVTPSVGVQWSASNVDMTARRGVYQVDLGLLARYEITRRIAPYVSLSRALSPRAQFGEPAALTRLSAGMRVLF